MWPIIICLCLRFCIFNGTFTFRLYIMFFVKILNGRCIKSTKATRRRPPMNLNSLSEILFISRSRSLTARLTAGCTALRGWQVNKRLINVIMKLVVRNVLRVARSKFGGEFYGFICNWELCNVYVINLFCYFVNEINLYHPLRAYARIKITYKICNIYRLG